MSSQLLQSVDRERLVALTRDLVRIPSVTGEEGEVAEFVARRMEALGLEVQVAEAEPARPNVVGRLRGSVGRPVLVYNGHTDIVPTGDRKLWSRDPYGGEVIDRKLYGRGSQDMKAGLAAMMETVEALRRSETQLRGDLVLEAAVDEERGGYLGTRWLVENGFIGDFGVVCEGGDLKLHTCHKGDYGVEIRTIGKATHAATPEKGVNAVHKMIDVANALLAIPKRFHWDKRTHPLAGPPLISLSLIEGGIQRNMVPDRCRMVVDRRVVPRFESVDNARREFQTVLSELQGKDPELMIETNEIIDVEPAEVSETEPVVVAMQAAAERALGHRLEVAGLKGFTDAHWMVNQHAIPTVSFGTEGENIHGVDEYVEIDSIVSVAKVLTQLASDLLAE